jgi:phosphate:Na+ symporter
MCGSIGEALTASKDAVSITEASDALRQAQEFMSEASGSPESKEQEERLTAHYMLSNTRPVWLKSRVRKADWRGSGASADVRAAGLCAEAMQNAVVIADEVGALPDAHDQAGPVEELDGVKEVAAHGATTGQAMVQLENCANTLRELRGAHRKATLTSVAGGAVSADDAMARVDTVRRLDALTHHAWRSATHLVRSRA